jgi:hypothetical protein
MKYRYYYNQVSGQEPWRNNLIYTSLISMNEKVFVQWYYNDGIYHQGQNQIVEPSLMNLKFEREVKYLTFMSNTFPDMIPPILDIDETNKKIYLKIDGVDFWQRSLNGTGNFDDVLPNWQSQMIEIIKAHHSANLFKYSMHPSSYFIIDGKLKSINYFFTYHETEGPISICDHQSHIYSTRQDEMRKYTDRLGISWTEPQPLKLLEQLCWDSFRTNYPIDFIEKVKCLK